MPLIFQYGSNTDAGRLRARLGDIEDLGRAQTVGEYDIDFNVWSHGNGCAASDLVPVPGTGRHAWGVLYRISDAQFEKLRQIEGKLYAETLVVVCDQDGNEITEPVTTFLVRHVDEKDTERRYALWTSAEYVGHIVNGLRAQGVEDVDPAYIQHVIDKALEANQQAAERAAEESRPIECLRQPAAPGTRGNLPSP